MDEQTTDKINKNEKPVTQVTSIAEEERRTGQKINMPDEETIVANANIAIFQTRKEIYDNFAKMGKKATLRAIAAIFTMPEKGMPVELRTKEEKLAFDSAQRHMAARFTVIRHHISQQIKKYQQETETTQEQEGETNE